MRTLTRKAGRSESADTMLCVLYGALRDLARVRLARESPGHTLQPTALVHEAYLRLLGRGRSDWESRGHFFAAAAITMRRILVERARRLRSSKRGGDLRRVSMEPSIASSADPEMLLALDRALDLLALSDPRKAKVVELRYFGGYSIEETAELLGIATATVKREWFFARAWLACFMRSAPRAFASAPQQPD